MRASYLVVMTTLFNRRRGSYIRFATRKGGYGDKWPS